MIFNIEILKELFFVIPLVLFIHEMEEWNIYHYHQKNYPTGVIEESILGTRLWLFFLSIVGFVWTGICYWIPNMALSTVIMMLLIDFTILNSLQHIILTLKTKKYNPGFIFGGIVALVVAIVAVINIVHYEIIPIWSVGLLLCLIIPILIESAVSSKNNKIPLMLKGILKASDKLEKFMSV
ncbi:HXXEE domain-containing protein [Zunongwangia pacifica]|uniref:HXXEE domain-containing protein n=1 Tax=Zunongwangia pacifica TaxID=2911062 RepID=A0A9X1ZW91_9FLAO|nr:HXXEE domain-containing protein [Zunongwangia pacifica]MCL6219598.1 HXXEE domain-containing protein [Zunongwangia pacifica]